MTYTLTSIKLAGGEETPRFEAKLNLDGKAVAIVSNGGTGGCNQWDWLDRTASAPFMAWIKANHPAEFEPDDGWVYAQLDKVEEQKALMRLSLKKALFRIDGDSAESFRTLNKPDSIEARSWLSKKYGPQHPVIFDRNAKAWVEVVQ